MSTILYAFPEYRTQAKQLAKELQVDVTEVIIHNFPDGESKLTLSAQNYQHTIFYCSLNQPNQKLIELLLAAKTARTQGTEKITLIAPYLCYMRQDKAFHPGEAVSQKIIGHWLSEIFDCIITLDPHLHRINSLDEVIPDTLNITLTASQLFAEFILTMNKKCLLIGPDEESAQWVKEIATVSHSPFLVATKKRHSDVKVRISLPEYDYKNQNIILIDDMISTGHTLAETALLLKQQNVSNIDVLVTHALFNDETTQLLQKSGVNNIWSSDSILHPSNAVPINKLLANAIKPLI